MHCQRLCQGPRLEIPLSTCCFLNFMSLNSRALLFLWYFSQNNQEQVVLVSWKAEGSQNRNSEVLAGKEVHQNAQAEVIQFTKQVSNVMLQVLCFCVSFFEDFFVCTDAIFLLLIFSILFFFLLSCQQILVSRVKMSPMSFLLLQ